MEVTAISRKLFKMTIQHISLMKISMSETNQKPEFENVID